MSPDPSQPTSALPAERRPAVWPWLLLPLVALTMFFVLRTVKQASERHAAHSAATEAAPNEAADAP
jgi:hypothetical protein